jgi:two-component system nitrogen regulation response regulator GlnG
MTEAQALPKDEQPIRILVLDDEESIRWVIEKTLGDSRYALHFADSAEEAIRLMEHQPIDLALVDLHLPGDDGWSFLQRQQPRFPNLLVTIITGQSTMHNAVRAMKLGAFDYLIKPFDIDEIESLVERAAQTIRATRRFPEHRAPEPKGAAEAGGPDEPIVGKSRSVREIYKAIGRVAESDLTVLILGESGTGKELVARAIHHHSRRSGRPFVAVNCAAIPRDLLESELFGHERGAFTGALERKIGRIELARGGTLLLDEIGDLPLELQAKLLRVLQELEFQRVGGTETIRVNARILAATNQNLQERAAQGAFREDLYYRIGGFTIVCEPLRERREDIPLLVEYFLRRVSRELGLPPRALAPEALRALQDYAWPGNVRELENMVKSLMITAPSALIGLADMPRNITGTGQPADPGGAFEQSVLRLWGPTIQDYCHNGRTDLLRGVQAHLERPLIRQVLMQTGWNQVKTARILGINRNTLRAKMQVLAIRVPGGRSGRTRAPRKPERS